MDFWRILFVKQPQKNWRTRFNVLQHFLLNRGFAKSLNFDEVHLNVIEFEAISITMF